MLHEVNFLSRSQFRLPEDLFRFHKMRRHVGGEGGADLSVPDFGTVIITAMKDQLGLSQTAFQTASGIPWGRLLNSAQFLK